MSLIDRIVDSLDKEKTLPMFSALILEMVKVDNWSYQYTALMSLSQIGEYVDDLTQLEPIIEFILNFIQNQSPKVRYAAVHCIGQFAEDCRPGFQDKYGKAVLPALYQSLGDSIPRVVYHTLNALTNLLEGSPKELAAEALPKLLEPYLELLSQGRSYVKESALTATASLAEACQEDFIPYWEKTAETIFAILNTNNKELKTARGNAIEAFSLLGEAVGREEFKKVANAVIEKMVQIQTNQVDKIDPQTNFLLASWHRIASTLQEDFTPYLDYIMPSIFKLVEDIIQAQKEMAENEDNEDESSIVSNVINQDKKSTDEQVKSYFHSVNTSESDEVTTAVKMMRGFALELQAGYIKYLERTSEILAHLIENSQNEEVRVAVAESFPDLIKVVTSSDHNDKLSVVRTLNNTYLKILWEAVWTECDPETMEKYVEVMQDVLTTSGACMNEAELNEFNSNILKTLALSDERKTDNNTYLNDNPDEFEEDEDRDMMQETNKLEEDLHIALAQLIGTVFKVYKGQTMALVKLIYEEILPKVLADENNHMLLKFGLFLIDDMIEHLGVELIPNEWPHLSEAILKFATHPGVHVRYAAIYGIGCLAEKSKDAFKDLSEPCMKVLYDGLQMKKRQEEDNHVYGSSRDNIISSVGKIIKSQHSYINLGETVNLWLTNLPLRYDVTEGKVQHELLVDIILEFDASLVFGPNGENLAKVIRVLAEVVNTKAASKDFETKVKKVIDSLMSNETTKQLLHDAVSKLEPKLQARLKTALEK